MKVSEAWLREWANPPLSSAELAESLTLAGLECAVQALEADAFAGVVVGEVLALRAHPNADKLHIAEVDVAGERALTIVCGAPNVREGMKVPVARVGARLPGGIEIGAAKLRGQSSQGMLCSARELNLSADASGLMALPADAPNGAALETYLRLNDAVFDLDLTPNRGDCLSVRGLAREISAVTGCAMKAPEIRDVPVEHKEALPIEIKDAEGCPRYTGRVVAGINARAVTPAWMNERLRRAGLRSIHPVVDVTNYVMLELGQPLHGFDLANLAGGIVVRRARPKERLRLLDGRDVELSPNELVIADHHGAKAMAGMMGGEHSGVSEATRDVFIESAFFPPSIVAGRARRYGLHTDASHRFERGVDPELPRLALERATELLIDITGGKAGPVSIAERSDLVAGNKTVRLRKARCEAVLAMRVPTDEATAILNRLGFAPKTTRDGWRVSPPTARFDIEGEHDLIEEIGRIIGFGKIPVTPLPGAVRLRPVSERAISENRIRAMLVDRGYQEAVTYSFVDPGFEADFEFPAGAVELFNPLSTEHSRLRRSLWPGLLQVLRYNLNQQRSRVRMFEIGGRFGLRGSIVEEQEMLSGLVYGPLWPEQWKDNARTADFFDLKNDIEALLSLGGDIDAWTFEADRQPALHPGRTARLMHGDEAAGWLGELSPALTSRLGFERAPLLFDLDYELISASKRRNYMAFSRFPSVRRDVAIVVDEGISAGEISQAVAAAAGETLRDLRIFDIYRGPGVDSGRKSMALGLILQESSRTLTDRDLETVIERVLSRVERDFGATLRE
jgi:phenylalanyl-tRNA synthetase beta chain